MSKTNKKRLKKRYTVILLLACLFFVLWGNKQEAFAAKEAKITEEAGTAEEAEKKESNFSGVSKAEWGTDTNLNGLFDSSTMYFQIGKWEVEEVQLELNMLISQLINREVSYLSILLDGQPVETIPIPEKGRETVTYSKTLPADRLMDEGTHSITVEAYLRGQTTDACVDDSSVSTWMNIFSDSNVTIQYQSVGAISNIAEFYEKFVSIEALDGELSMVLTKEGANDAVLTSMAKILSGFSQNTAGDCEKIRAGLMRTEKDVRQVPYVIYMDSYDRLPDFLSELLPEDQKNYSKSDALVCLLEYGGTKVLLVTGNNDAALQKAGDMLSNPDIIPTLTEKAEPVSEKTDYRTDSYQWNEYIQLTPYGAQIKGNFEQSASFGIECPTNRKLSESAQLSLDYRYSSNLDFDKSLLTVYINGTPIGSRVLTEEGADGTTELFTIPKDIGISGSYTVETRFALYPKGEWCELTAEEIPWAYISDTSMLKWTTTENTEVFFEYYPFPFIRDGEFSNVKILLPEEWEKSDLDIMAGTLLTLGKWQKSNAGKLEVMSNPDPQELADINIISIGAAQRNHMNTEELKLTGDRGCAVLGVSPYGNKLHAVLTITGQTNEGMKKTLEFLGQYARTWEVKGDLFYTDGEFIKYTYIRQPEVKIEPPKVEPPAVADENVPLIIVCSVLVLILLAAAMLLIKYGRKE